MNLPNALSLLRLLMVPGFVVCYLYAPFWAAALYAAAMATDVLDGYLARRLHLITALGRVLDPLADKLMSVAVLFCLSLTYPVLWWVFGVVFVKEGLMGLGALLQYRKISDVPPSTIFGKICAFVFFAACLALLLFRNIPEDYILIFVVLVLLETLAALITYSRRFFLLMKKNSLPKA